MKLLKKTLCLLLTIALVSTFAGCGEEPDQSVNNIRARGVLKVAVPNTESSMFYFDDEAQDYRGLEAEMIDVLAAAIGVEKEYVFVEKELLLTQVLTGVADVAIGQITADTVQNNTLYPSASYGSEKTYIVTPRGVYAGDKSIFENRAVGVSSRISQGTYGEYLYINNCELMGYNNSENVIGALNNGIIGGYVCFKAEADYLVNHGDYQVQLAPGLSGEEFVIAILPTATNLISGTNFTIGEFLNKTRTASWVEAEPEE